MEQYGLKVTDICGCCQMVIKLSTKPDIQLILSPPWPAIHPISCEKLALIIPAAPCTAANIKYVRTAIIWSGQKH